MNLVKELRDTELVELGCFFKTLSDEEFLLLSKLWPYKTDSTRSILGFPRFGGHIDLFK